jgi:hypothetical protein
MLQLSFELPETASNHLEELLAEELARESDELEELGDAA